MDRIVLDGNAMRTREDAHRELMEKLSLPAHYGKNLDALFDCASTAKAEVWLINAHALSEIPGNYGRKLIDTLSDAARINGDFTFHIA